MRVFTDLSGNKVERSKDKYPYSYDEFVSWIGDYDKTKSKAVYSDRLYSWDSEKFDKCSMEVWNSGSLYFYNYNRNYKEVERFLSLYLDMPIKLTAIVEGCNVSNGSPYWVFYYEEIK